MKINIGKHEFSIIWDGIYYRALSILKGGSILSAVKARNISAEQLS